MLSSFVRLLLRATSVAPDARVLGQVSSHCDNISAALSGRRSYDVDLHTTRQQIDPNMEPFADYMPEVEPHEAFSCVSRYQRMLHGWTALSSTRTIRTSVAAKAR